jgi:hypothetical protein
MPPKQVAVAVDSMRGGGEGRWWWREVKLVGGVMPLAAGGAMPLGGVDAVMLPQESDGAMPLRGDGVMSLQRCAATEAVMRIGVKLAGGVMPSPR